MAAKKKTKKTPVKKSSKKTAKKPAKIRAKGASRLASASNSQVLADAGVIDFRVLGDTEVAVIDSKLTAAEVETLIAVYGKLSGAIKDPVRVQLCF